jgi:hypothetical protein
VVEWPGYQVGGNGCVSASQHRPGPIDTLLDEIGLANGELLNRPIHHLGLGRVDQGRQVANAHLLLHVRPDRYLIR